MDGDWFFLFWYDNTGHNVQQPYHTTQLRYSTALYMSAHEYAWKGYTIPTPNKALRYQYIAILYSRHFTEQYQYAILPYWAQPYHHCAMLYHSDMARHIALTLQDITIPRSTVTSHDDTVLHLNLTLPLLYLTRDCDALLHLYLSGQCNTILCHYMAMHVRLYRVMSYRSHRGHRKSAIFQSICCRM